MAATLCPRLLAFLAAAVALPGMAAADCTKQAERKMQLDTGGATKIMIAAGAGELRIKGEAGRNKLSAEGRACASDQKLLDNIQLESRRDGDTLYVKAVLPEATGFLGYARLDLDIALPDSIELSVSDSSGDSRIENVRALSLTDSSGDLEVIGVRGDLALIDSSGDLEVRQVGGNLSLTDSSGDVDIVKVTGKITIEVDSSGDIRIDQAGSVHILADASGEIRIDNVQGDVLIDADSSGDISVDNVRGKFTVGADSSGSIRQRNVAGAVSVPRK